MWQQQARDSVCSKLRDKRDRERKVSPLVRAQDAVLLDNTAMDVEETARVVIMLARECERELGKAAGRKT